VKAPLLRHVNSILNSVRGSKTIHEIGEIDRATGFFGVGIGKKAIIDKFPAKHIGDDDNYAGLATRVHGFGDVCGQPGDRGDGALWLAVVDKACNALGTHGVRHCEGTQKTDPGGLQLSRLFRGESVGGESVWEERGGVVAAWGLVGCAGRDKKN